MWGPSWSTRPWSLFSLPSQSELFISTALLYDPGCHSLACHAFCALPPLLCVLAVAAPTSLFRSVKCHLFNECFPELSLPYEQTSKSLSLCLNCIIRIFAMISVIHTLFLYLCLSTATVPQNAWKLGGRFINSYTPPHCLAHNRCSINVCKWMK